MLNVISVLLGLILIALNVADWKLTSLILSQGGRELNGVMKFIMDKLGVENGLKAKVALVALVTVFMVWAFITYHSPIAFIGLVVLDTLYGWVIYHNYNQVKK